ESLHRLTTQDAEHEGARIPEQLGELPGQRGVKPVVDDIAGESSLFPLQNLGGQELPADLPMKPLATSVTNLEPGAEALSVLDDGAIEVRHPDFETVRHRQLVTVHE